MADIPATFYRKTKHKKPKHQLYIPGFNPANSCWLHGSWVTVSGEEWEASHKAHHKAHHKLFKAALKGRGKQTHRDPATALDALTEAQRMAYEHYSGQARFDVRYKNGSVGPVGVDMAGNRFKEGQAKWMRDQGMKIIRFTTTTGKTVDTLEGLDVPADLIHEDETPIDPWVEVVAQNVQRDADMFYGCLESNDAVESMPESFLHRMAMGLLILKEEAIIQQKWNASVGREDKYDDIPRDIELYKAMRAKAEEVLGDAFADAYEQSRASHNQCARANLGDTGVLFCFVLPKFNADGTHEPWGPRDVPWGDV